MTSTTSSAGRLSAPSPLADPPRSLTTTLAPCAASSSASPRPMPWPDPVTTAIFPSKMPMKPPSGEKTDTSVTYRNGAPAARQFGRIRRPRATIGPWPGSTLTPASDTVSAPAGPPRAPRRARPVAAVALQGVRSTGARTARHEGGTWQLGPRRRATGWTSPAARPPSAPSTWTRSSARGGGRRRRVGLQRPAQHGADPEDHRLGRGARGHGLLRQPQPARGGGPALCQGADRHRRAARPGGHPGRGAAADPARRRGGPGEVRRRLRRRVRRGRCQGRAAPGPDGADHSERRGPRARPQHQPQRVRGLPRGPARQGDRPHHPERAPGPARVPGPGDRDQTVALGPGRERGGHGVGRLHQLLLRPRVDGRRRLLHRGLQERPHPSAGGRRRRRGARCPSSRSRSAAPTRARPWPRRTPAT